MVRNAMASSCWDDGIEILSATPDWVTLMARCDSVTADRLVQFLGGVREPVLPENDREAVGNLTGPRQNLAGAKRARPGETAHPFDVSRFEDRKYLIAP